MALISFEDSQGVRWRVWNVARENLSFGKVDYLGQEYRTGWLVFQREGTDERRRLARFPDDWASLTPTQLERLCDGARVVASPRLQGDTLEITRELPRYEP
jgi:hypothetical protein